MEYGQKLSINLNLANLSTENNMTQNLENWPMFKYTQCIFLQVIAITFSILIKKG